MLRIKQRPNFFHFKDVERDGRKAANARDPPGQKSVYIPPGKHIAQWFSFIREPKPELF